MKRLMTTLLALLLAFALTACGQTAAPPAEPAPEEEAPQTEVDLSAFYRDFMARMAEELGADNVPQMAALDQELLSAFYPGLTDLPTRQLVAQTAVSSAVAFEMVLLEAETEADADAAEALFRERLRYQAEEGAWYPATAEVWAQGQVLRQGSYVALIAAGTAQEQAADDFQALFA